MGIQAFHKGLENLHVNCEKPHAYFIPYSCEYGAKNNSREQSPYFKSLCGEWDFRFYESFEDLEDDFFAQDVSSCFNKIKVPMNWQLDFGKGYDTPLYSNLRYPFPTDPPHVPENNPCGLYMRTFNLEKDFAKRKLFLNFEGVNSALYVWVNDEFAGYSQVSHCTSEFYIGDFAKEGENKIAVLVVKWCDGSYLEDQDYFRLSGIFREVYILARADTYAKDVFIKSDVSENFEKALLNVSVELSGKSDIDYHLFSPCGKELVNGKVNSCNFEIAIENPVLWNDEEPYLYELFLKIADEVIMFKVGIKSIVISNGAVLLNGKPVKAKGINRHDNNAVLGHATSMDTMLEDLYLLKKANCNAIRTSHYPNDPRFVGLCDELGFMVIDESDIETHGMGYDYDGEWDWPRWSALSDSPEWEESYVDRAARLFERDKNHVCVVMWSLGNESGVGKNHRAMRKYIKSRDERAIVHYENSHLEFKSIPEGENYEDISDVESRMYAPIDYARKYLENPERKKPFFLCEYVDSVTTGDIHANWNLVEEFEGFFGACVWEMCDHTLAVTDEDGNIKHCYGGDFGDYPNDNICCIDGVLYADRKPRPGYYDMKRAYQPYGVEYDGNGSVAVFNKKFFTSLSDTCMLWKIESDGKEILNGKIASLEILPRETKSYKLFNNLSLTGICYLTLTFVQNKNTAWADKGYETGFEQFRLESSAKAATAINKQQDISLEDSEKTAVIEIGDVKYTFDKAHGCVTSIKSGSENLLSSPIKFKLWKAPWYNGQDGAKRCREAEIDNISQKTYCSDIVKVSDDEIQICSKVSFGGPSMPPVVRADVLYSFLNDGSLKITIDGKIRENAPPLPRIGWELIMPNGFESMEFFGKGPFEAYVDKNKAAKIGLWKLNVTDNFEHYVRPQENSSHYGTVWGLVKNDDNVGLHFRRPDNDDFSFNASHFTSEILAETKHDSELSPLENTVVNLDWKILPASGDAAIAKLEPERVFDKKDFNFSFVIAPINANK